MSKFWKDICLIPFVVLVTVGGLYLTDQAMRSHAESNYECRHS